MVSLDAWVLRCAIYACLLLTARGNGNDRLLTYLFCAGGAGTGAGAGAVVVVVAAFAGAGAAGAGAGVSCGFQSSKGSLLC